MSTAYVREIFTNLESGDDKGFFDHLSDALGWIVEGTHPLAGHYHSQKDFLAHTFSGRRRIPLPASCQNFLFDRTILKDTSFTASIFRKSCVHNLCVFVVPHFSVKVPTGSICGADFKRLKAATGGAKRMGSSLLYARNRWYVSSSWVSARGSLCLTSTRSL